MPIFSDVGFKKAQIESPRPLFNNHLPWCAAFNYCFSSLKWRGSKLLDICEKLCLNTHHRVQERPFTAVSCGGGGKGGDLTVSAKIIRSSCWTRITFWSHCFPSHRWTMEPSPLGTKCKSLSLSSVLTCDSHLCLAECFLLLLLAVLLGRMRAFPLHSQSSSAPWFQFKWFSFLCQRAAGLSSFCAGKICITHRHLQWKFLIKYTFQLKFLLPGL